MKWTVAILIDMDNGSYYMDNGCHGIWLYVAILIDMDNGSYIAKLAGKIVSIMVAILIDMDNGSYDPREYLKNLLEGRNPY